MRRALLSILAVAPSFGPGLREAAREFLASNDAFVVDKRCERLLFTVSPGGYLARVK